HGDLGRRDEQAEDDEEEPGDVPWMLSVTGELALLSAPRPLGVALGALFAAVVVFPGPFRRFRRGRGNLLERGRDARDALVRVRLEHALEGAGEGGAR